MNDSINFTPEETFNVDVEMENGFNTDILVKQVVTDDYEALKSKPQINNITLSGNLSLDDLNIQEKTTIPTKVSDLTNDSGYISQIKTINNQSLIGEGNINIQGGGGSSDYSDLTNKPSINSVTLSGNKSLSDLGIQPSGSYLTSESDPLFVASASYGISSSDITAWNGKLDASKVKTSNSTTSGDVYDVTYINTMLGDIESLLGGI